MAKNTKSKTIRLYRVQNILGEGPYRADDIIDAGGSEVWTKVRHSEENGRPCPHKDGLKIQANDICAFASRRALMNWFTSEHLTSLKKFNMEIYSATVERRYVRKGRKQVLVKKSKAKWVRCQLPEKKR